MFYIVSAYYISTMLAKRMKRNERMKQILDCTIKLLGKKSLDAIRTAEIAKAAGISEGALFKYFRSKDELIRKIIESYLDQSHPLTEAIKINTVGEFRDFIDCYLTSMITMSKNRISYLKLLLQISMDRHTFAEEKYMNIVNGFWKIAEDRIEYGKIHWGFNSGFHAPTQVRLLQFGVLMFTLEQEVFGANKYDPFDLTAVKDLAIDNFFYHLTQ